MLAAPGRRVIRLSTVVKFDLVWNCVVQLTRPFLDDPLDVLGRQRVFVVVGTSGDVGCVHCDSRLDLGLRLTHLVIEHLKEATGAVKSGSV